MRVLHVILCYISLKITSNISTAKIAQCSITGFTLSLVSSRNRTGYWTSQVCVCYYKTVISVECAVNKNLFLDTELRFHASDVKLMEPFMLC
jgi:hypothetical protein